MRVRLSGFQLTPYSPYLNQFALLKQVAAHGKLSFLSPKSSSGTVSGKFNGGFSIDKLAINEEDDGAPFLSWDWCPVNR